MTATDSDRLTSLEREIIELRARQCVTETRLHYHDDEQDDSWEREVAERMQPPVPAQNATTCNHFYLGGECRWCRMPQPRELVL